MRDHHMEGSVPRRSGDLTPITYAVNGEFPNVVLSQDAPPSAHFAVAFAKSLHTVLGERDISLRSVATAARLSHPTVSRILNGEVVPDLRSIASLEVALQVSLYPAGLFREFADDRGASEAPASDADRS